MDTPEPWFSPFSCRYCGIPKRAHAQQWKAPVGWHVWVRPTDAQIKARMLKRREDLAAAAANCEAVEASPNPCSTVDTSPQLVRE